MQGGASAQFAIVPLNLTGAASATDYVDTGHWSQKAIAEARRYCTVYVAGGAAAGDPAAGDPGGECRRVPPQSELELQRGRGLCALHAERDHQRRRVRVRPADARRAAGRRHVLDHLVAAHRCIEVRTHLRRRAEEHRAVRPDGGDRARGSHRAGASRDAVGVRLQGRGRRAFDVEYAADLRLVHGGPGVQMAEKERRPRRHGRAQPRQGASSVRRDRRLVAVPQLGGRRFALPDERDLHA